MSGGVPAGELKPCPFCGQDGKALVGPIRDGAAVCCSNFKCLGQVQAFNPNAREKAITAWNTRATPTPPIEGRDADVERVARALCEYQIRQARRWDTDADVLEAMLPAAVTHGWPSFMPQARAALQALGERG